MRRQRPSSASDAWGPLLIGAAHAIGAEAEADTALAQAAALAGEDAQVWLRLGTVALQRRRCSEARAHHERALALAGESAAVKAAALAGLGQAWLLLGDAREGERVLRAALGARFFYPAVHVQLGVLYLKEERWGEADAALRTALRQQPGLAPAEAALRQVETAVRALLAQGIGGHANELKSR